MRDGESGPVAYLDESVRHRDGSTEYLIAATIVPAMVATSAREVLRPLLLRGQVKLHWTKEGEPRRRSIAGALTDLGLQTVVVAHVDGHRRSPERYRRKCLETLYPLLADHAVRSAVLESRGSDQDAQDRAHIVALQGRGEVPGLRISHRRGGDEPLLWIPDAVLGAVATVRRGRASSEECLLAGAVLVVRTPGSRTADDEDGRSTEGTTGERP